MTFEQFAAEAERLGLTVFENSEFQWAGYKGSYEVQVFPKNTTFTVSTGRTNGDAADALREAARLMRGDVAGKLREWLETASLANIEAADRERRRSPNTRTSDSIYLDGMESMINSILAKLDELEGIE